MTGLEFEDIIYEKKNGVARITINRPQALNAFRSKTLDEMTAAFEDAEEDEDIRVVVLTGAGDRAFCSGGDISEMGKLTPAVGRKFLGKCLKLSTTMRNLSKPIIARINGYCLGGGNELNMFCDLSIASEKAVLGQVGPRVGSVPIWGGTQMLPRVVGEKKAREMIFLCRRYTAKEAEAMGLVNKVVPHEQLDAEVDKWCEEIKSLSPQSLKLSKISLNFGSDLLYPSFVHGRDMLALIYGSYELTEGMEAFMQKRKPVWKPEKKD